MWLLLYLHITDEAGRSSAESKPTGVNQFWLIALKNCEIFADIIKVHKWCQGGGCTVRLWVGHMQFLIKVHLPTDFNERMPLQAKSTHWVSKIKLYIVHCLWYAIIFIPWIHVRNYPPLGGGSLIPRPHPLTGQGVWWHWVVSWLCWVSSVVFCTSRSDFKYMLSTCLCHSNLSHTCYACTIKLKITQQLIVCTTKKALKIQPPDPLPLHGLFQDFAPRGVKCVVSKYYEGGQCMGGVVSAK